MRYVGNCTNLSLEEQEKMLKGTYKVSYKNLINKILIEYPELYENLSLSLWNPFSEQCRQSKTYYILVHSAIEFYFEK